MNKIKYMLFLLPLLLLQACDKHGDPQGPVAVTDQQKVSISMRGTWAQPYDVSVPFGTSPEALDGLSLTFRIDDSYAPSTFKADGAPYFFTGDNGTWKWADETNTLITLTNITPITNITVTEEGTSIRLTFNYAGTGGRTQTAGGYGVSLKKIAP